MPKYEKRISIGKIKDDLADYGFFLKYGERQKQNLMRIRQQMVSVKGAQYSIVPTKGGGSQQEDRWVELILQKDKLESDIAQGEKLKEEFEGYFQNMEPMEVDIVKTLWVHHSRDGARSLSEKYCYSVSNIYRRSDEILSNIARIRYGVK